MNQGQPTPPVEVGDIIAGKYRVEKVLGLGGMGVVVAATHVELHELRALKFMLPKAAADRSTAKRFMREARAAVRLKSEHVARILDIGRLPAGEPFIVMEYLEGEDLKTILEKRRVLPTETAVDYIMQALVALAEAHALGIVHRDVKPANLFVCEAADGRPRVKVVDFGISKLTGVLDEAELDPTRTAAMLGSPHYMSPEQMECTHDVDARSDIWSLGVILYEMLVGTVPFEALSITALSLAVVMQEPGAPSDLSESVPDELDRVVLRCLAKKPGDRYGSVVELAADLAPFGSDRSKQLLDMVRRVHEATVPPIGDKQTDKGQPEPDPDDPIIEIEQAETTAATSEAEQEPDSDVAAPPKSERKRTGGKGRKKRGKRRQKAATPPTLSEPPEDPKSTRASWEHEDADEPKPQGASPVLWATLAAVLLAAVLIVKGTPGPSSEPRVETIGPAGPEAQPIATGSIRGGPASADGHVASTTAATSSASLTTSTAPTSSASATDVEAANSTAQQASASAPSAARVRTEWQPRPAATAKPKTTAAPAADPYDDLAPSPPPKPPAGDPYDD